MQLKYVVFLAVVAILALAVSIGFGFIVGEKILGEAKENSAVARQNTYVTVITYDKPLPGFTVNTTFGEVTIPVEGKINIVTPQYVYCPDVCHWETSILYYTVQKLYEEGLLDEVVIVTIGVNPYYETLIDGKEYQLAKMGDFIEKGLKWYWVLEQLEKQRQIWEAFGIGVVPYCKTVDGEFYPELSDEEFIKLIDEGRCDPIMGGGVNHTAGFFIVDKEGMLRYFVAPSEEGWIAGQKYVAEALYELIYEMIREG